MGDTPETHIILYINYNSIKKKTKVHGKMCIGYKQTLHHFM